ncbi:hypothetical protein EV126DRAFT_408490 [Verticillium dahliae]|nr:hypothetical protein EV126DRAFT_408490 [Verticillium dahliae]
MASARARVLSLSLSLTHIVVRRLVGGVWLGRRYFRRCFLWWFCGLAWNQHAHRFGRASRALAQEHHAGDFLEAV